jgi:ligand-binding sensor domain-containing protein/AraC-like DNA-binding protein
VKKTIIFFLLINIFFIAGAQKSVILTRKQPAVNQDFYHLKMPGGIEQNSISKIIQDSLGQMWFATKDGLIRYNGKKLFVYKNQIQNPHSIGFNFITDILIDNNNRLWIGTEKGLYRYRYETDDFEALKPKILSQQYITQIQKDLAGNLWIINHRKNRLYQYMPALDSLQLIVDDNWKDNKGKINLLRMVVTPDNRFFIINHRDGFIEFIPEKQSFIRYDLISPAEREQYRDKIYNLFERITIDKNNPEVILITTHLGYLISYNFKTKQQQKLIYNQKLTNHGFHCFSSGICQDNQNNIWLTTWFYGTYKILPDRKHYIQYLPDPDNPEGISNTITTAVYQDNAGYMWFGNEYQGVDILKKNKKFSVYPAYPHLEGQLPSGHYLSVIKDTTGRFWVGMEGGLYAIDSKTLQAHNYTGKLTPGAKRYFTLMYDKHNNYWIGTEKGVYHLDENLNLSEHLVYQKDNYNSISGNFISALLNDKKGHIWIGSFINGLTEYIPQRHKFYRYVHDEQDPKSISNSNITAVYEDDAQQIWVGTQDGLNLFNKKSGRFTIFKNDIYNNKTIGSSVINVINGTGDSIWIGTQGGGLSLYDKTHKSFKNYTVSDGLPDNNVKSIQVDEHRNLWLATTKNIVKFNPKTEQFTVFGASDGLKNHIYVENMGWQELSFSDQLSYKDKKGYMFFGGSGGLVFFHPDSLPQNTYKAPLNIEKIKVNGKSVSVRNNKLNLKPDENHLEFEFTLTNLIQSGKNRYEWRLEPYDSIWRHTGASGKAEYFNLPSGKYRLYYKAANNDGYWTQADKPFYIVIAPRFYQTKLFYMLIFAFLFILIIAFWLYKWYIKKQLENKRKKLRYSTSNLNEQKAKQINERLISLLNTEKIYLEPDINLHKLANLLQVKPNYLSQVINQYHKQNFYEFINTYRVEEAKRLLKETTLKIEAVAYDSGFNSLSTFNAVFKKVTGKTPSQFRKSKDQ